MLAIEDQWCKGRLHDRKGRHCLVGAITEVNGRQELTRPIIRAIKEISGKHYWRIELFNDDPGTNHWGCDEGAQPRSADYPIGDRRSQ